MKIGIDCRTILNPEKGEAAGIGHYTYQLVRHLLEIDKKNHYYLFFDRSVDKKRLAKFSQNNVFIRFFPFNQYKKLISSRYQNFLVNAIIAKENLDVIHFPSITFSSSYQGPSVVTVHDLTFYKFSELIPSKDAQLLKKIIPETLKNSRKIIAVSKSTAQDIRKIFTLKEDKIEVVYHGFDKRFFTKRTKKEIEVIKRKFKIRKKYFLFLGTLDRRKNIIRLVESYERLRQGISLGKGKIDYRKFQLVLAGAPGQSFSRIKNKILKSEYKEDIIIPGYIKADDLGLLFSGASLFVFPSLYEGFGSPILEAMAKNVPVITSNHSSMAEISSKAALLVNPYDVGDISRAIDSLLKDKGLAKENKIKGNRVARNFSWEKCAKKTLVVYKKAAKK